MIHEGAKYEVSEGHYHIPKKYRLPLEGVMGVGWVMADYGGLVDWVVGLKAHIITVACLQSICE